METLIGSVKEVKPKLYALVCTKVDGTTHRIDSRSSNLSGDPRRSAFLMDEAEVIEMATKFNASALNGDVYSPEQVRDVPPPPFPVIDYKTHPFIEQVKTEKLFCISKLSPSQKFGKVWDKKPLVKKGFTTDDLMTADAAVLRTTLGADHHVAYYVTKEKKRAYIDLDNCRHPVTGHLTPKAQAVVVEFAGGYIAPSISGTGLQIVITYTGDAPDHSKRNEAEDMEVYTEGKLMTLGLPGIGDPNKDCTDAFHRHVDRYHPETAGASADPANWSHEPHPDAHPIEDDDELISKALESQSMNGAMGVKATFKQLFQGDEDGLAIAYPSENSPYNARRADAGLAQQLVFWTGGDHQRIEDLMYRSALVRDKWEEMRGSVTYLRKTILHAVALQLAGNMQKKWYGMQTIHTPGTVIKSDGIHGVEVPQTRGGTGFMTVEDQLAHFDGCVYIESMNAALVPDGSILKPEAFSVRYGGYQFVMDRSNSMRPSKKAFEAFTQSTVYSCVKAYSTCFKPQLPFGTIVTRDGQRFANAYRSITIDRKQGDVSPFLNHIAKLLPDERDRTIMLSYMAAVVQHQGTKFMWAPLLQGVQGNGKSLLSKCVEQAVGARYTYWPKATELGEKFNAWMKDKVLYAVEDVYVPDSRVEIMEALKPMITGQSLKVEKKGVDQEMADICGNFIFNSNHKEALRVNNDERRYCIFITPQQVKEDLERDGMDGRYFPKLIAWLYKEGGFAIVSEFLHTYAIPAELNPAGDCQRAPVSTTFHEAVAASQGGIEQDLEAAVEECAQGFRGGWVSSTYFEQLPRVVKSNLTRNKRHEILVKMGYMLHPALKNGWTDNLVLPDGKKAKLYIRRSDSMLAQLKTPSAVAKHYQETNGGFKVPEVPAVHSVTSM
jgi:hypothetical protein